MHHMHISSSMIASCNLRGRGPSAITTASVQTLASPYAANPAPPLMPAINFLITRIYLVTCHLPVLDATDR
eukprot:3119879-Pyramimonas_sp.AAC.1